MTSSRACLLLASLSLLLTGCSIFAPTVSVDDVGPRDVFEELSSFVLNSGELSMGSRDVLHTYSLTEAVDDDPRLALEQLHAANALEPLRATLFALAELSFLIATDDDDRDAYLASAVYAYRYLFDDLEHEAANPFERRFRWACDLYNRALMHALMSPDGKGVEMEPGVRPLPVGSIRLTVDRSRFPWTAEQYPELLPADHFTIKGLTLRLRDAGLGVALIAVPRVVSEQDSENATDPTPERLSKTPATLFLRLDETLVAAGGELTGTLELSWTLDASSVTVEGREVPLESDFSVVLAHALHESPLWKFSLRGLFQGQAAVTQNRLIFLRTPVRGRVPMVFVHGTASNPAYWAEMFNVLLNDPLLRARTQSWFFQYATGNPLVYSAMTLRDQLRSTIESLDPDGTDTDLRRMVIIGHSQGGLVAKLMVVQGEMAWFEEVVGRPVTEFGFSEEQLALMKRAYEFEPLPFVDSAVFMATPHQGSFLAGRWIARFLSKLIAFPGELQGTLSKVFADQERLPAGARDRVPTSLENMNPSNPLLQILYRTPIAGWVTAHSIIAIGDADPDDPASYTQADDGVVEYTSAHIEPVASELRVQAGHSCQSDPIAIREVLRVLREHLLEGSSGGAADDESERVASP